MHDATDAPEAAEAGEAPGARDAPGSPGGAGAPSTSGALDAGPRTAGARPDLEGVETWATGRLLSTAARLVEHAWDDALRAWDLNHARVAVLSLLLTGPASQRELAHRSGMEEQTMGGILKHMEAAGHVDRTPDAADRRRRVVTATASGRAALTAVVGGVDVEEVALGAVRAAGLDPEDFRRALLAIVRDRARGRWGPGA